MNANNVKPRWSFYTLWIILTTLCLPVAFFIDLGILKIIIHFVGDFIYVDGDSCHITEDYLGIYPFVPIAGLLTGAMQYGLLRRYLPRMGWWVLATTGGWLLGVLLIAIPSWLYWTGGSFNLALALVLMGLAIGLGQWLVLRRRLPRASWWIGANVVGWGLFALMTPGNALNQRTRILPGLYTSLRYGSLVSCANESS